MKITCDRELFSQAFHLVIGAVPSKTPKDILLTVQVKAEDGAIEMCATDLDIGIKSRIENVKVEKSGVINLIASKMSQILKKSTDDMLVIEEDADMIRIKIGKNKFSMVKVSPEEFPIIASFPTENIVIISGEALREAIQKTHFASSKDSSRWALNGIYLNVEGSMLEAVATDSKRLAYFRTEVQNKGGVAQGVIIPNKAMAEVQKILDLKNEEVEIAFTQKEIFFKTGKGYLITRLVDGKFPPYKQVLPSDIEKKIQVSRVPFTNAMDQASIFISESSMAIKLTVDGELIELKSRNPEAGESEVTVGLDQPAGFQISIGFNPIYILEFLRVLSQETVEIQLKDGKSMGVFLPKGQENYKYLVMPVSLEF